MAVSQEEKWYSMILRVFCLYVDFKINMQSDQNRFIFGQCVVGTQKEAYVSIVSLVLELTYLVVLHGL